MQLKARYKLVPNTIDRYMLGLACRPLAIALGVVLVALLLERVLRIINMLTASSAPYWLVAALTATLVPHYMNLALAAAFFIAVFVAMSTLGGNSELDAIFASGVSIWRITLPYVLSGCVLAIISFGLDGFVNPVSRYNYHWLVTTGVKTWDARVPLAKFTDIGHGVTLNADAVDQTGRNLIGVFISRRRGDILEVTSAHTGHLELLNDDKLLRLTLQDGLSIRQISGGLPDTARFGNLTFDTPFDLGLAAFRARGEDESELTIPELWENITSPGHGLERRVYQAELADRLVRVLTFPFLPLLAVPLSFAGRATSRTTGLVVATVLLVTYNNTLQLSRDLAATGHGLAVLTGAVPFAIFAMLAVWLFVSSATRPVEAPVIRLISGMQSRVNALVALLWKKRQRR